MKVLKIILLLLVNLSFSQEKDAIVNYKVFLNDKIDENSDVYKKIAYKGLQKINFELLIQNKDALFRIQDKLTNSDSDAKMAIAFTKFQNNVYFEFDENTYYYNNLFTPITPENEFIISVTDTINWEITSETKLINNYVCFKAKKRVPNYGHKTIKEVEIIAWFCPEINLSYGPLFYNGLPGLIFELQEQYVTYIISSVEFKSLKEQIDKFKPIKGKNVTLEEYNIILENRFSETKEYLKDN